MHDGVLYDVAVVHRGPHQVLQHAHEHGRRGRGNLAGHWLCIQYNSVVKYYNSVVKYYIISNIMIAVECGRVMSRRCQDLKKGAGHAGGWGVQVGLLRCIGATEGPTTKTRMHTHMGSKGKVGRQSVSASWYVVC